MFQWTGSYGHKTLLQSVLERTPPGQDDQRLSDNMAAVVGNATPAAAANILLMRCLSARVCPSSAFCFFEPPAKGCLMGMTKSQGLAACCYVFNLN